MDTVYDDESLNKMEETLKSMTRDEFAEVLLTTVDRLMEHFDQTHKEEASKNEK
jgi:molecular chaperone DnaK (HSP70)